MSRIATDLIESARRGDAHAVERLLRASSTDVARYARRHCDSDDVDEAVQDALWIIGQRVASLKNLAVFASWAYSIVRRLCLAALRRRRGRREEELTEGMLDRPHDPELRLDVARAIARLPEGQRHVLILKDILGYRADEIATELAEKLEAVKGRLHRARAAVRDYLEDAGRDGDPAENPRLANGVR